MEIFVLRTTCVEILFFGRSLRGRSSADTEQESTNECEATLLSSEGVRGSVFIRADCELNIVFDSHSARVFVRASFFVKSRSPR